jgi:hypothetical protein
MKKKERKQLLDAFQKRDQDDFDRKLEESNKKLGTRNGNLETSKSSKSLASKLKSGTEELSTLLNPTLASMGKIQLPPASAAAAETGYSKIMELESRLSQIENVPKLGQPNWRNTISTSR